MGATPPRVPPSFPYLVGERGPEFFLPEAGTVVLLNRGETVESYVSSRRLLPPPQLLHDGEWFVRVGERQAARASSVAAAILMIIYLLIWVLA